MSDVRIMHQTDGEQTLPVFDAIEKRLDSVRARAYELFESRDKSEGSDLDDWLQAEREVLGSSAVGMTDHDDEYEVDQAEPVSARLRNGVLTVHAPKFAMNELAGPLSRVNVDATELRA